MAHCILYMTGFGGFAGGGQHSLYLMVKGLDKSRFRPVVVVPGEGGLSAALRGIGVEVAVLSLGGLKGLGAIGFPRQTRTLSRLIRDKGARIVHTDSIRETFYAAVSCRMTGAKLVWHIRDDLPPEPWPRLQVRLADRLLAPFCGRIILPARALAGRFGPGAGGGAQKSGRFSVVYNGVDLSAFGGGTGLLRAELGLGPEDFLVGEVAAITPRKGQDVLIRAASLVIKDGVRVHAVFVGEGGGSYADGLRALAAKLGIADSVHFIGQRADVSALMADLNVLALPSWREAMPRSVLEAMAAGVPVVASDVGGVREAVEDGETGFVVPPGDHRAFADRIGAIASDPRLRESMGARAREKAEAMFDAAKKTREVEAIYEGLL